MYTNLCSLSSKFDLFLLYVNTNNPSVVIITETWLNSNDRNSTYNMPGYTLIRLDRKHKKSKSEGKTRGGGVAMYVRDNVNGIPIIARRNRGYMCDGVEALYVDIQFSIYHFLVVGVYRSDDKDVQVWKPRDTILLNNLLTAAENNTVIIAGDFNYPAITWPTHVEQNCSDQEKLFINCFQNSNLFQLVNSPTRFRQNQAPSLWI